MIEVLNYTCAFNLIHNFRIFSHLIVRGTAGTYWKQLYFLEKSLWYNRFIQVKRLLLYYNIWQNLYINDFTQNGK